MIKLRAGEGCSIDCEEGESGLCIGEESCCFCFCGPVGGNGDDDELIRRAKKRLTRRLTTRTPVRIHAVNVPLTLVARILDAAGDRELAIPANRVKRRVTIRRQEPIEVR